MVTGLNHLTLAVSDLDRSVAFYSQLLGFCIRTRGPSSAYLEAGALWLALVADPEVRRGPLPEYSHIALSVKSGELPVLRQKLSQAGAMCWQQPGSIDSFYFLDPDGHKLELHSGDLRSRLAERKAGRDNQSPAPVEHAKSGCPTGSNDATASH
jgi:catechol 2,3-dioxygenase-like lactoylglutathione lyase family enzyme